jgi:hypothetical protein
MFNCCSSVQSNNNQSHVKIGCEGAKEHKPNARITYVNGMNTTDQKCKLTAMKISMLHKFNKVHYVYDPSEGIAKDLVNCTSLLVLHKQSEAVIQLTNLWTNLFKEMDESNNPNCYIVHYAHSKGGLITDLALKNLPPHLKEKMIVYTMGSPVISSSEDAKIVKNIANSNDKIPYSNPLRWINLCGYSYKNDKTIPSVRTGYHDHAILGQSYMNEIEELGKLFAEGGYDALDSRSPLKPTAVTMEK